jgi:hypothetical protein
MTAREKMVAREQHVENVVTLYRAYRDATLWGALSGHFHFYSDYKAYRALVTGDPATLKDLTRERILAIGQVPGFHERKPDPRRKQARDLMDAEYRRVKTNEEGA